MAHHTGDDSEFQNLTDELPAAVIVQVRGRFAYLNREALKILGETDSSALVGKPILSRIPRERWAETTARISRANRDRIRTAKAEQVFLRTDGSRVSVEISSTPFRFGGQDGALVFVRDLTEENNFVRMVEELPAGVFVQTRGQFALVNQEARRILGVPDHRSILGEPVVAHFSEINRPQVRARIRLLNEQRQAVERVTEEILRADGTVVPVEVSAIPTHFRGEQGALVFLRDLTEEHRAKAVLETKERLLRLTGAMAKVGGWEFSTSDGKGTWTDEVARIHDVDPAVPTDMNFGLKFYTPDSRLRIETAIMETVTKGVPFDVVLELISATGRHKWVRSQGTPVLQDGRVVGVQGIFQDITEPWLAGQAVREEKERLRVTLRSIGDGVITTDTSGNIILMSQSAEDLTGWTQEDAQGKSLTEVMPLIHEWTRKTLENPVSQVLRDGKTIELANHTLLVAKDGREKIIADSAAPILDERGTITGVVLVFRDMTEKQKLAEALQRAQNLESIGLLAAGIAHDFNNLLSGLFGQIQLAADKVGTGRLTEAQVNFDRAMGVFDRARDLTGQLLTFSKGGVPVRTPCDLGNLVKRTVQFALAGSNVGVQFEISPDLRTIPGDPNQLAQAVDNLVINARQAMPSGGNILVTATNRTDAEGRWALVTIQDQGPGIPPEILARIFDPFYTTKPGGHGLGLAAVQSIVQRHEGKIEVESTPGRGTLFRIALPAG